MPQLRSLDLFCGVGGIALALEGVCTPLVYSEWDPHAIRVLEKLMDEEKLPRAPIVHDVRDTQAFKRVVKKPVDIIISSSSCVGFSASGGRAGLEHPETQLFMEVFKLMTIFKPNMVFMENVPCILSSNEGRDFSAINQMFHSLGYDLTWGVYAASDVGAWHRRKRWFGLATRTDAMPRDLKVPTPHAKQKDAIRIWGKALRDRQLVPPGLVPKSTHPHRAQRLKMMGNAVVPACVRAAFAHLYAGGTSTPDPRKLGNLRFQSRVERLRVGKEWTMKSDRSFPSFGLSQKGRFYECPPPTMPLARMVSLNIVLDPGVVKRRRGGIEKEGRTSGVVTQPVTLASFATPRAHNTGYNVVLTNRSLRDLGSQLRFSVDYTPDAARDGEVNVHFVEFIMGFPRDWTALPAPRKDHIDTLENNARMHSSRVRVLLRGDR